MANTNKNQSAKNNNKADAKVDMMKKMMANTKKNEADKQKLIYSAMNGLTIVRN